MKNGCGKSWWSRLLGCFGVGGGSWCDSCRGCGCSCRHLASGEVSLDSLAIGQKGEVTEVAGGDEDMVNRFADHGLVRGITVSVHEQALFGGPMLISAQGTMVALRRREAQLIRVRVSHV